MSRIAFGIQAHSRGAALDDAGDHLIRQPPGLDSLKLVKAIGKATRLRCAPPRARPAPSAPGSRSRRSLAAPGCNHHYDSEIGLTIPARSATNTVTDVGGPRRVDHPHDLQFDARRQNVEQSTSAAEQH